ncbi:hypothetical protein [Sulfuricurvum sp.]|uniref:hypothetical protein n=1 Tax=Sulfuricurvum sp. TaxID=2025608 RepID=UPI003562AAD8
MANVRWYIDVKYKDDTEETFGPYDTEDECNVKWKELAKQTAKIKTIEKRREINEEP